MSLASAYEPRVTVRAAAKVNLHLGVGRARADGFHQLATVYHAISLHDDVTVGSADDWEVHTDLAGITGEVPGGDYNIAVRAGRALAGHHGLQLAARIEVHKGIPVAAGLAGGSADAAATLVALDRLWDLQTSDDDLLRIAAGLGSDVPFALVGGTALGTGRGELVEPLVDPHTRWWVVVPSDEGLSTPKVYRRYDQLRPDMPMQARVPEGFQAALTDGDPTALAGVLHNDLQVAALDLRPDLADLLAVGEAAGALRGIVSGSGPTCVFLCADRAAADAVRGEFLDRGHDGVQTALGPVAGVHVVEPGGLG